MPTETAPVAPAPAAGHADTPHVLPLRIYLAIYAALMVLTAVTVQVSLLELGAIALVVAMVVAVVKASLVAAYFMHLRFDDRFNTLVFVASLGFLALMFALTMMDLATRGEWNTEEGNFVRAREVESLHQWERIKAEQAAAEAMAAALAAAAALNAAPAADPAADPAAPADPAAAPPPPAAPVVPVPVAPAVAPPGP